MLAIEPVIIEQYVRPGQVRLIFRDVLNHGQRSLRASEAAACAGQQGLFWEMHALLFEHQAEIWGPSNAGLVGLMMEFGTRLEGLDQEAYGACLTERRTRAALEAADAEQRSRGITWQPTFEIGDRRLIGLQLPETLAAAIDEALK